MDISNLAEELVRIAKDAERGVTSTEAAADEWAAKYPDGRYPHLAGGLGQVVKYTVEQLRKLEAAIRAETEREARKEVA